jgi:hypothetical protein
MKRFFCLADSPSANVSNFGRTPLYDAVYIIAMMLLATSCIYDAPGDKFYRTLWVSEETSCGKLTIEFLCGGSISVKSTGAVGSYGTYTSDDHTAHFSDLRLHYPEGPDNAPVVIILEEAYRTGDELVVIWHHSDSSTSYTTRLVRKGSYE